MKPLFSFLGLWEIVSAEHCQGIHVPNETFRRLHHGLPPSVPYLSENAPKLIKRVITEV